MDTEDLDRLERSYRNARTNRALGAYISVAGAGGLIAEFLWGGSR